MTHSRRQRNPRPGVVATVQLGAGNRREVETYRDAILALDPVLLGPQFIGGGSAAFGNCPGGGGIFPKPAQTRSVFPVWNGLEVASKVVDEATSVAGCWIGIENDTARA